MKVTNITRILSESLNISEQEVLALDPWSSISDQHPFDALDVVELHNRFKSIDPHIKIEMFEDEDPDDDGFLYNNLTLCGVIKIAMPELYEKFDITDVVKVHNDSSFVLHCSTQQYDEAIVLSVEPFVLASMRGDMRWSVSVSRRDFEFVRKASADEFDRVSRRLRG